MARYALTDLLRSRIVVAPMAGGPSTAELVIAAARAGALGFLAAGYKTPGAMAAEIAAWEKRMGGERPWRARVAAEPALCRSRETRLHGRVLRSSTGSPGGTPKG